MNKLRPINGNIILRPVEEDEPMAGNIIIPDIGKERPEIAEVIAVSNIYNFNKGEYAPTTLEVGMKVFLPTMGTQSVIIKGEEYWIANQNSILTIIE
jgi:chaperonin GroES